MEHPFDRIIVALDPPIGAPKKIYERVAREACSRGSHVKVGIPYLLEYGIQGIAGLSKICKGPQMVVADFKMADIGFVMRSVASRLAGMVDAIIAHAFVGIEGGLRELKELLDASHVKLVLVVSMSHKGSQEVMDKCLDRLIGVARELEPWGVVAPATRPESLLRVRRELEGVAILSPGVGLQGGQPGDAICLGADYEIIGRAVTRAKDPGRALDVIANQISEKCLQGLKPGKNPAI